MQTAVVIGGNRGIGLGFVAQYLEEGYEVIATYRNEETLDNPSSISEERSESLVSLKAKYGDQLSLYKLEATDFVGVTQFAQTVKKIDLLILNAGIKGYAVPGTRPQEHGPDDLMQSLLVNTVAVDHIVRSFFPLLVHSKDACVVYMSSLVGLVSDDTGGGYHVYRIAKAATNMAIWNWSIELMLEWKKHHVEILSHAPCAVAICPGWVRTDMGGPLAGQSVDESVSRMKKVIEHVRETKKSNRLYMHDGKKPDKYAIPDVLKEIFDAKTAQSSQSLSIASSSS